MKIRKLTNEEIKGACAFAVSIYNIAIRGCFRTQDCHRYFDEYMDADRLTDEERTGVLVVFGAFDSNVLCGVCGMTNEGHITMLVCASAVFKTWNWQKASGASQDICTHAA